MTPYKVAIIGLGRMGSTIDDEGHFEVPYSVAAATKASTRLELVAGADLQSEKRDAFSERWNVAVYEDFREMIAATKPDVVGTQPHLRSGACAGCEAPEGPLS